MKLISLLSHTSLMEISIFQDKRIVWRTFVLARFSFWCEREEFWHAFWSCCLAQQQKQSCFQTNPFDRASITELLNALLKVWLKGASLMLSAEAQIKQFYCWTEDQVEMVIMLYDGLNKIFVWESLIRRPCCQYWNGFLMSIHLYIIGTTL